MTQSKAGSIVDGIRDRQTAEAAAGVKRVHEIKAEIQGQDKIVTVLRASKKPLSVTDLAKKVDAHGSEEDLRIFLADLRSLVEKSVVLMRIVGKQKNKKKVLYSMIIQ